MLQRLKIISLSALVRKHLPKAGIPTNFKLYKTLEDLQDVSLPIWKTGTGSNYIVHVSSPSLLKQITLGKNNILKDAISYLDIFAWNLIELANHPIEQSAVQNEIADVMGTRDILVSTDLPKMNMLKCVVKETIRVRFDNFLVTTCGDFILDNYFIPRNTRLMLCYGNIFKNETSFPNPLFFNPARWLCDNEEDDICESIIEPELYVVLVKVLSSFIISNSENGITLIKRFA
ncbi:ORF-69 [Teiidae poxvirus 1]|nr:ORF-69 [Teiidae poxvirus 1]